MKPQTITTPSGERLVVLPEADFQSLVDAADEAADRLAVQDFRRKLAEGAEELVPAEVVDRILLGENRIRVWRDHRKLSAAVLAERAGIAQSFLSQLETGRREGKLVTLRKIAAALNVTLDELAG